MTFNKTLLLAATALLLSSPIALAANGNGTTLAGGDNGKAAKQDSTAKSGEMSKEGSMSKSGDMKKDGMEKSGGKM